ncbi:MAG: bifunctional serine/threonine-protein kinase/formylglycine-generating enzyme family protein, partial [Planctomycetota bacterium]
VLSRGKDAPGRGGKEGEDRYDRGDTIGQGGLGRVIAANDRVLHREVAIKEMVRGRDSKILLSRFMKEGEIAGRLTHPNVIPIHDVGVRETSGEETPYFVMTRIKGRDLEEILDALQGDVVEVRGEFTRGRLLGIFQDVCQAVAYAHDHEVIHRDIKPSNIMVGEYGEVYLVDWGLAKVKGEECDPTLESGTEGGEEGGHTPPPLPADTTPPRSSSSTVALTLDGDVLGTPSYMPPEQAAGRNDEIDERSDIYSLGAVLYKILTLRPPYEGRTKEELITKVLTEEVRPPSIRLSRVRTRIAETGDPVPLVFRQDVPSVLEKIVLKAMAREKSDRYTTAMELHGDLDRFLDGEKEKERNHRAALEKVTEGRARVIRLAELKEEWKVQKKRAREVRKETLPQWPAKQKRRMWAEEESVRELELEVARTFGEAGSLFQEALGFERENAQARAGLADLYWERFLEEENAENRGQMVYFGELLRKVNDGQYDARLKGDGLLSIHTRTYACDCMTGGRSVGPAEMDYCGYHPLSARSLDGREGARGYPEFEPTEPIRLRLHHDDCHTEPVHGADVWLFRFEERDRILVPAVPDGVDVPGAKKAKIPPSVLGRLYDPGSPFRPDEGLHLGKSPVEPFPIPMGSYLLILAMPGFHPVRMPVTIARSATENPRVTLFKDGEIPEGFVQIPAGKFQFQGDPENEYAKSKSFPVPGDFFMRIHPITCREYLAFLNELVSRDPRCGDGGAPRDEAKAGHYWYRGKDGLWEIPTPERLREISTEARDDLIPLPRPVMEWGGDFPVLGISFLDILRFTVDAGKKSGYLLTLPHEVLWEKAARGTDGRYFVSGNHSDPSFFNANLSHDGGCRTVPVGSFPIDESPYGVRGLGGNARDFCIDESGAAFHRWRNSRGGIWSSGGIANRLTFTAGGSEEVASFSMNTHMICMVKPKIPVLLPRHRMP